MNLSDRVQASNADFRARGLRVRLELRGQSLYLRRMLPPKPDSSDIRPSQQRIATGLRGEAGLRVAKKRAELLDAECDTNRFFWENWGWEPPQDPPKTVGNWVEAFEAQWRAKGNRAEVTWSRDYWEVFKRLPQQALLTDTVILDRIKATQPRTKTRDRNCMALACLAKFAGINIDLSGYRGYERSHVQPRLLPADRQLARWRDGIRDDAWQYLFGLLICYGLRPHELFHLHFDEFPVLEVSRNTKTGWRYVGGDI